MLSRLTVTGTTDIDPNAMMSVGGMGFSKIVSPNFRAVPQPFAADPSQITLGDADGLTFVHVANQGNGTIYLLDQEHAGLLPMTAGPFELTHPALHAPVGTLTVQDIKRRTAALPQILALPRESTLVAGDDAGLVNPVRFADMPGHAPFLSSALFVDDQGPQAFYRAVDVNPSILSVSELLSRSLTVWNEPQDWDVLAGGRFSHNGDHFLLLKPRGDVAMDSSRLTIRIGEQDSYLNSELKVVKRLGERSFELEDGRRLTMGRDSFWIFSPDGKEEIAGRFHEPPMQLVADGVHFEVDSEKSQFLTDFARKAGFSLEDANAVTVMQAIQAAKEPSSVPSINAERVQDRMATLEAARIKLTAVLPGLEQMGEGLPIVEHDAEAYLKLMSDLAEAIRAGDYDAQDKTVLADVMWTYHKINAAVVDQDKFQSAIVDLNKAIQGSSVLQPVEEWFFWAVLMHLK